MKYIVLDESDDSILFEYGDCRGVKTKQKPLHLSITGFTDGLLRPPTKKEIDKLVALIFVDGDKKIPNIRAKMFTNDAVHIWEDNELTRQLLNT